MPEFWERIAGLFDYARDFYARPAVEVPGLLCVEFGLEWIRGFRLSQAGDQGGIYSEDQYRDSTTVFASEFLNSKDWLDALRKRLIFGFDLDTPEGL